jgi:hypothetical protein
MNMDKDGWSDDMSAAPHEKLVLLYWKRWDDSEYMEAGYASTGKRFPNGYSTMSFHGDATHWRELPPPPSGPRP